MVVIALVGTIVAALVRPNQGWAIVLPPIFLTLLLTALLGVLLRRGSKRAFWVGVALFGWAYMALLAFSDDLPSRSALGQVLNFPLAATLDILMQLGLEGGTHLAELPGALGEVDAKSGFAVVCSIMGLLFAGLGGVIARWLSGNERPQTEEEHVHQRSLDRVEDHIVEHLGVPTSASQ
jgi:hypothetical protein